MHHKSERNVIPFELFMTGVSVYGMTVAGLRVFLDSGTDMQKLFLYFDWVVCVIFVIAFLRHMILEKYRLRYFCTWGILDLLSALRATLRATLRLTET